eukprot:TRINITY_DN18706_c0_g1_i1.p1 TRINITY_DN18706_c0_g1~~TRINITY_DN18706_c0_g1_i1.p1  ORF type:complete len:210 (+),score=-11.96 TRINITY_DN18706_c0_g1_i1:80-631(+)
MYIACLKTSYLFYRIYMTPPILYPISRIDQLQGILDTVPLVDMVCYIIRTLQVNSGLYNSYFVGQSQWDNTFQERVLAGIMTYITYDNSTDAYFVEFILIVYNDFLQLSIADQLIFIVCENQSKEVCSDILRLMSNYNNKLPTTFLFEVLVFQDKLVHFYFPKVRNHLQWLSSIPCRSNYLIY